MITWRAGADGQPGYPILSFVACGVVVRRDALLEAGVSPSAAARVAARRHID